MKNPFKIKWLRPKDRDKNFPIFDFKQYNKNFNKQYKKFIKKKRWKK